MLSPIVEFLLSQRRPSGGRLCHPARWQYAIPNIPPGVTLVFAVGPGANYFAAIKYASSHPDEEVPDVILVQYQQSGDTYVLGPITSDHTREYLPYFIVFTQRSPLVARVTNISALNQPFYCTQWNIMISSEEDFNGVMRLLDTYGLQTNQKLATEANELLKDIKKLLGGRR